MLRATYLCGRRQPTSLSFRLGFLFRLDRLDDRLDLFTRQVCNLLVRLHDSDFNVLGSRLNDLEQTLDGQLDRLLSVHVGFIILFQKLADRLGLTTDGVGLPGRVDSTWLGLIESRDRVVRVKPDDKRRDTKRSNTS